VVSSLLREYKEKLTFFKFLLKDLEHSTLTGMTTAKKTKKLKEERAWFTTAYKQPQLVLALLKAQANHPKSNKESKAALHNGELFKRLQEIQDLKLPKPNDLATICKDYFGRDGSLESLLSQLSNLQKKKSDKKKSSPDTDKEEEETAPDMDEDEVQESSEAESENTDNVVEVHGDESSDNNKEEVEDEDKVENEEEDEDEEKHKLRRAIRPEELPLFKKQLANFLLPLDTELSAFVPHIQGAIIIAPHHLMEEVLPHWSEKGVCVFYSTEPVLLADGPGIDAAVLEYKHYFGYYVGMCDSTVKDSSQFGTRSNAIYFWIWANKKTSQEFPFNNEQCFSQVFAVKSNDLFEDKTNTINAAKIPTAMFAQLLQRLPQNRYHNHIRGSTSY